MGDGIAHRGNGVHSQIACHRSPLQYADSFDLLDDHALSLQRSGRVPSQEPRYAQANHGSCLQPELPAVHGEAERIALLHHDREMARAPREFHLGGHSIYWPKQLLLLLTAYAIAMYMSVIQTPFLVVAHRLEPDGLQLGLKN